MATGSAVTIRKSKAAHKIGWIGMGRMGYGMASRLLAANCDLTVWNRTRSKAQPLSKDGAKVADKVVELAACDIVFTMVSTTADLKQVLFEKGGLLSGKKRPKVVIDCSSISDDGSAEVRASCEKLGVGYLCAPVSGNGKVAKAGLLWVVASGPKKLFALSQPYLAMFGRGVTYVGEGELARVWKIAHNTMFGVIIQSLCEITILAEKAGIPRHMFLDSINNSVLGSMYTRYKTPALVNLDFSVTFTPRLLLKDMDLGLAAARKYGVQMPAAAVTRECVQNTVGRGYEDVDFSVLLLELAKAAGMKLEPENVKVSDGLVPR
jgi:3-hydroxyisobutyrate dehydrogenase